MNFLAPKCLQSVSDKKGAIAVNYNGTLLATSDDKGKIYIDRTKGDEVSRVAEISFSSNVGRPCFVHRRCVETLLVISDQATLQEFSLSGSLVRVFSNAAFPGTVNGIAYCPVRDVVAVSSFIGHSVFLLDFESGKKTHEGVE